MSISSNISFNSQSNALTVTGAPSIIVTFPKEILELICRHLNSARDVVQFTSTNKKFYLFASNSPFSPPLWNLFLRKDFPDSCAGLKSETKSLALYKRLTNAVQNMKAGKCRLQTLSSHQGPITCMTILDGKLISCSDDNTIKIWDLKTGKELLTLNGHERTIACMTILDGKIISGSWDRTIKIWDLSTGEEIQTLNGHRGRISCMKILDGKIISGSWNHTIKIWNLSTGEEIQTLNGDRGRISCMKILDGKIISGSFDGTIKIWDLSTGEEIQTLDGHRSGISCMKILDGKLISGSSDGTIKIWNLSTGEEIQTLNGHQDRISCMKILDGKLISGSSGSFDGTIKIWDLSTGEEIQTLDGHRSGVRCMTILDGKLISGSFDGTIKIWDLSTGEEIQTLDGHRSGISCMKILDGKIISGSSDNTIKIWDFNFPSLSSYPKEVLEENLEILGEMAHAEYMHQPEVVKELAKKLHPDFKERLRQHSYKIGSSFFCSAAVILRVQTEVCVEALLDAIYDEDHDRVSGLLKQLIWIDPQNTKIYELLWQVCGKIMVEGWGERWGEHAFHNRPEYPASLLQKEQAVVKFKQTLKEKWGEDLSLLLVDLGIVSKEEYSEKLKCTPDHLPKIGICSPEDLQALWNFNSPNFQYLKITAEEIINEKDYAQLQTRAFGKQEIVSILLDQLLAAAKQKSAEAKQCSVILADSGIVYAVPNPWVAFLEKLNSAQAALNAQGLTRDELLDKFSPESYAELVKEANALIDEFRTLESETQIVRLYAYVNQWGILKVWNKLRRDQGIHSLAALLQQKDIAPQDIFNMGE